MTPERLPIRIDDGRLLLGFLGEADVPWLRTLLEVAEAQIGAPWRQLDVALAHPVAQHVPRRRQALAVAVLRRLLRGRVSSPIAPRKVRAAVFDRAAAGGKRDDILRDASLALGFEVAIVEAALFADLPPERLVTCPLALPTPHDLALHANLLLCRSLLACALAVRLQLRGNARTVVRIARLRGLLCTVEQRENGGGVVLDLSGPLSLFRRTTMYGHALGALIPALAWCDAFEMRSTLLIAGAPVEFRLTSGDPFLPASEKKRYDSAVEKRLARDLRRHAASWVVVREPEPIRAGPALIFPDFALAHRDDPSRRWLLEIVGFWTPAYLEHKLNTYRLAGLPSLILCIDERLACSDGDLPDRAHLVRYRKHVDVEDVLRILDSRGAPTGASLTSPTGTRRG